MLAPGTIIWRASQHPTGPCPKCGSYVKWGDMICQQCGHKLSDSDIEQIKQHMEEQKEQGIKNELIFWSIVIVCLTLIYYLVTNIL